MHKFFSKCAKWTNAKIYQTQKKPKRNKVKLKRANIQQNVKFTKKKAMLGQLS